MVLLDRPLRAIVWAKTLQLQSRGLPRKWEPAKHSKHKIGSNRRLHRACNSVDDPVEGPNIIYEVASASTARVSGIDPLGSRC